MTKKFIVALAVLAAVVTPALGENEAPAGQTAPEYTKAEVQELVNAIRADPARMKEACVYVSLLNRFVTAYEKKALDEAEALTKQMFESGKKIGGDFDRVMQLEMDAESETILAGLIADCGR
jgi:hypothetical protein